jgi:hypothetical protein
MMLSEFLNEYNRAMSPSEIDAINDSEIKDIKRKYWNLKHTEFINEKNNDSEIVEIYNKYVELEKKELVEYFNNLKSRIDFINQLNKEQLDFLNKNINNFDKKETDEIAEYLMDYLQRKCIIDSEVTEEGIFVESILDILGKL